MAKEDWGPARVEDGDGLFIRDVLVPGKRSYVDGVIPDAILGYGKKEKLKRKKGSMKTLDEAFLQVHNHPAPKERGWCECDPETECSCMFKGHGQTEWYTKDKPVSIHEVKSFMLSKGMPVWEYPEGETAEDEEGNIITGDFLVTNPHKMDEYDINRLDDVYGYSHRVSDVNRKIFWVKKVRVNRLAAKVIIDPQVDRAALREAKERESQFLERPRAAPAWQGMVLVTGGWGADTFISSGQHLEYTCWRKRQQLRRAESMIRSGLPVDGVGGVTESMARDWMANRGNFRFWYVTSEYRREGTRDGVAIGPVSVDAKRLRVEGERFRDKNFYRWDEEYDRWPVKELIERGPLVGKERWGPRWKGCDAEKWGLIKSELIKIDWSRGPAFDLAAAILYSMANRIQLIKVPVDDVPIEWLQYDYGAICGERADGRDGIGGVFGIVKLIEAEGITNEGEAKRRISSMIKVEKGTASRIELNRNWKRWRADDIESEIRDEHSTALLWRDRIVGVAKKRKAAMDVNGPKVKLSYPDASMMFEDGMVFGVDVLMGDGDGPVWAKKGEV